MVDTLQSLTHYDRWYITIVDSLQSLIHYIVDTLQSLIHYNRWYITIVDTLQPLIHYKGWYITVVDRGQLLISYNGYYRTVVDTVMQVILCSDWHSRSDMLHRDGVTVVMQYRYRGQWAKGGALPPIKGMIIYRIPIGYTLYNVPPMDPTLWQCLALSTSLKLPTP